MKKASVILLTILLIFCCSCAKSKSNLNTDLIFTGKNETEVNGELWGIGIGANLAIEYKDTYKGAFDIQCGTALPDNEEYSYEKIVDFETYQKICKDYKLTQNFKNPKHNYIILAQKTTQKAGSLTGALVAVENGYTSYNFKEKLVYEQGNPYITIYHNIRFERVIPLIETEETPRSWFCIIPTTVSTDTAIHIDDDVHST